MPPKRKVGLKRIDAAVDALRPMGFSPDLIRRKVKALLKEYGDEGWVFIEEAAYKLLIEFILEEQEKSEKGEPSSRDKQIEVRDKGCEEQEPEPEPQLLEAAPLIEANESISSNPETALTTVVTDAPLENPSVELKPSSWPSENVHSPSKMATSNEVNKTEETATLSESYMLSCPPGFEQLCWLQLGDASAKSKPCLGWMDMDPNKDDQSFLLLEPAPVLGWRTRQRPRKRKSRWDVGPNDVV
ncbi:putative inactive histone-lysine N-methyltransferase SUVR1 [Bienertia sinuspersici]